MEVVWDSDYDVYDAMGLCIWVYRKDNIGVFPVDFGLGTSLASDTI